MFSSVWCMASPSAPSMPCSVCPWAISSIGSRSAGCCFAASVLVGRYARLRPGAQLSRACHRPLRRRRRGSDAGARSLFHHLAHPAERSHRDGHRHLLDGVGGSAVAIGVGGYLIARLTKLGGLTLPLVGHLEPWQAVFLVLGAPGLLIALLAFTLPETGTSAAAAAENTAPLAPVPLLTFLGENKAYLFFLIGGLSLTTVLAYAFFVLDACVVVAALSSGCVLGRPCDVRHHAGRFPRICAERLSG